MLKKEAKTCKFPDDVDALTKILLQSTNHSRLKREVMLKNWDLSTLLKNAAYKRDGVCGGKTKPNSQCLKKIE